MTSAPRPLIGITSYPLRPGARIDFLGDYVDAVRRAGADAVLLPPGAGDPARVAWRLDGLILAGGGDLDPATYGGPGHRTIYALDPERDADELALVGHVFDTGLPTLAICRGHQVLNVALGGTLITHLPDALDPETAVAHRIETGDDEHPGATPHLVTLDETSLPAGLMGSLAVEPMSWHHQAVDRLGRGLRAVGWAEDGTIEAVAHDDHPWLVSVQWHPELTAGTDVTQQRLFDGLAAAAGAESRTVRNEEHP